MDKLFKMVHMLDAKTKCKLQVDWWFLVFFFFVNVVSSLERCSWAVEERVQENTQNITKILKQL